jgi:WD40 repeat protein
MRTNSSKQQSGKWIGTAGLKAIVEGWYWFLIVLACTLPLQSHSAGPSKTLKRRTTQSFETVHSLAFSPAGKTLAVGSSAPSLSPSSFPGDKPLPEETIELWDLDAGKLTSTLRQNAKTENGDTLNQVGALTFSPDGKWLIRGDIPGHALGGGYRGAEVQMAFRYH